MTTVFIHTSIRLLTVADLSGCGSGRVTSYFFGGDKPLSPPEYELQPDNYLEILGSYLGDGGVGGRHAGFGRCFKVSSGGWYSPFRGPSKRIVDKEGNDASGEQCEVPVPLMMSPCCEMATTQASSQSKCDHEISMVFGFTFLWARTYRLSTIANDDGEGG